MPLPFRPSELCATVPSATSSLCDRLLAVFLKLPALLCQWVGYMFNEDGTITDTFKEELQVIPTGMVICRMSTVAPAGWLTCDGQEVSRTTYSLLFSVIGTTFGAGNGTTTFNLPDLRSRFIYGKSNTTNVGDSGGEETHVLSSLEARPGTLLVNSAVMNKADGGNDTEDLHHFFLNSVQIGGHVHDGLDMTNVDIPLGSGTANDPHNTLPPYVRGVWMIKT